MKRQRYFTLAPSGLGEEGRQLHCCPGPHVPSLLWTAQFDYLISSHKAAYLSAQGSTCCFDPSFNSGFCCHSNICTLQLWPRDWAYYLSSALILTSYSQFSTPLWCQPKTPMWHLVSQKLKLKPSKWSTVPPLYSPASHLTEFPHCQTYMTQVSPSQGHHA